jgi:hypothetical protein
MGTRKKADMPKFTVRTYTESVEYIGKLATLPNTNIDSEIATVAYIYQQDLFKVGKDVMRFASRWNKLISKDNIS